MPIGGVETDEQRRARQKKESEDWYAARLRGYLAMHGVLSVAALLPPTNV